MTKLLDLVIKVHGGLDQRDLLTTIGARMAGCRAVAGTGWVVW